MENKKILVAGASGLIGRALCEELCRNNEVWGLASFSNPRIKEHLVSLGVKLIIKDIAREELYGMAQDFDYVFSELALLPPKMQEHPEHAYEVNAFFVGRLMEHCRNAKGIILGSTAGIYRESIIPVKEDAPVGYPSGLYSISKFAGEMIALYVSQQLSVSACMLRYNWPYGPHGGIVYDLARDVADEKPIAVNRKRPTWYGPHYISDCVRYTIEATKHCSVPPKPINVAGTEVVTQEELLTRIGEKLGKAPRIVETDEVTPTVISDISLLKELMGEPKVSLDKGIAKVAEAIRKNSSSYMKRKREADS